VYLANNTLLKKDSKASCQQLRTISKKHIVGNKIGNLVAEDMKFIDNALRLHLNL
jgi:mRNA-degrading endonuclease toxin of MazEF toxin-antitoxin module